MGIRRRYSFVFIIQVGHGSRPPPILIHRYDQERAHNSSATSEPMIG